MKTIFIVLGLLGIALLFLSEAKATGSCRTHHCDEGQKSSPTIMSVVKDDDGAKATLNAVGGTILLGCAGISGYQGLFNQRWNWPYEWCFGLVERKPGKAEDDARVTPSNLSDKPIGVRIFQ